MARPKKIKGGVTHSVYLDENTKKIAERLGSEGIRKALEQYDEDSITINNRPHFYVTKGLLVDRYPEIPPLFIGRLLEACEAIGYPVELAERKYLRKDADIPSDEALMEAFREILKQEAL